MADSSHGEPGSLLTIKQYDQDPTDAEMAEVQRSAGRTVDWQ
jgi:hypothetical protein